MRDEEERKGSRRRDTEDTEVLTLGRVMGGNGRRTPPAGTSQGHHDCKIWQDSVSRDPALAFG